MSLESKTKILCIFDGFGLSMASKNNCIANSKMPNLRILLNNYKWTTLNADGDSVGQESGLVGNSEVGHMNLGGLKLVPQLSYQITYSAKSNFNLDCKISPDQLFDPKVYLQNTFQSNGSKTKVEKTNTGTIHLLGLFSKGKIHSDLRHWAGAIVAAGKSGATKIVLDLISDGRDSDRRSLVETWDYFTRQFASELEPYKDIICLGSITGRFYTMDRDNNVDRVLAGISLSIVLCILKDRKLEAAQNKLREFVVQYYNQHSYDKWCTLSHQNKAFLEKIKLMDSLTNSKSKAELTIELEKPKVNNIYSNLGNVLKTITKLHYENDVFDEMITPSCFEQINPNETIWLLNFRTDRFKQISKLLSQLNNEFELELSILGMNFYDNGFEESIENKKTQINGYFPIFKNQPVKKTLAKTISSRHKTQLHIAETEKFNHVTYFLNGGQNLKVSGEDWVIIPSNKVDSHAQKPHMKAEEVTNFIVDCLDSNIDLIPVKNSQLELVQTFIRNYWIEVEVRWNHGLSKVKENNLESTLKQVYKNIFRNKLSDEGELNFITFKGEIVGFVNFSYYNNKHGYFITDLCIKPEFQSRGFGTKVIEIAKSRAKNNGCTEISLWVDIFNLGAKQLYEKCSFIKSGTRTLQWYNQNGDTVLETKSWNMVFDLTNFNQNVAKHYDYIIVNYANPDMVAHTGDIQASIQALEFLDIQLGRVIEKVQQNGDSLILTADHGNIEFVGDFENNGFSLTDTEHNASPVPCIIVDSKFNTKANTSNDQYEILLKNIEKTDLNIDKDLITKSFNLNIDKDFETQWFEKEDIEELVKYQLPLYYAGIILLGL